MFGISFPELIVVMVVALIVLGPKRLPEIARTAGRWSGELRKHSDAFRREFYNSVYTPAQEIQERIKNETRSITSIPPTPAITPKVESEVENKEQLISPQIDLRDRHALKDGQE